MLAALEAEELGVCQVGPVLQLHWPVVGALLSPLMAVRQE